MNDALFVVLGLQLGNYGSGMGHRSTMSNTVETLKHEETADQQPDLFAHVNGLRGNDAVTKFDKYGASCAKWLGGFVLSREVLQ